MKQLKTSIVIVIILFLAAMLLKQSNEFDTYKTYQEKLIKTKIDSIKTLSTALGCIKNDFGYRIHNVWKRTSISIPNAFDSTYFDTIQYYANKYNIPEKIVYRIIVHESQFDIDAYNKSGATGLFQIKKCYWYQFRDNETDWNEYNRIKIALRGLCIMYNLYKRWDLVLSTYGFGDINHKIYKPLKSAESFINFVLK
jgi:hypothetical protein